MMHQTVVPPHGAEESMNGSWPVAGAAGLSAPLTWPRDASRECCTTTGRRRAAWIVWQPGPAVPYAPPADARLSTSRASHYAILHVAPAAAVILPSLLPPVRSGFDALSAGRLAALRAAVRRLAVRAAIVRASGVN